ncbi:DNA-binding transcriptional LysR family regulator [Novosphingobium chloroacetimidivorans]|uniref:DNA-binding transcriptional LysR family regulator n=1 Tax=Novosphingobium chloroacetimidivorans TaxID=1428314 RepID=A0A7W7K9B1_9SPHN|nr:LysR family transcriptional regulator [Novosphingobium chloroacetimidivorans]MBB4858612.1 DNA-binding transcriptional LysR family regulator [Novosphingobium chloroacetimidivorans]
MTEDQGAISETIAEPPAETALPPFASLRAFEAVFRFGGIRKAAAQLGLHHAVVSRHVQQLEAWLGGPLVARSGNRLALTEDGERFHARVAAAFAELQGATEDFTGQRRMRPFRLWCVPGLSIQWLSAQLADFEDANRQFRVELKPTEVPANLGTHEADADIRYYRDDDPVPPGGRGLRCHELARPPVIAVASPAVATTLGSSGAIDWRTLPFLHEENDHEWRAWLRLNGLNPTDRLEGPLCWQAHLTIAAARQGRGVALATRFLVDTDLKQGTLVPVEIPQTRPVALGGYVLVAREDRWSDPVLLALRKFLSDRARSLA